MSDFNSSNLTDLTNRTVTAGAVISSTDHEAWRNDVESRVADSNDMHVAHESNFAGSSAPARNTVRGKIWADTSVTSHVILKLDPDAAGADNRFHDSRMGAYGKLGQNVTPVSVTPTTTLTLQTFAIPAGFMSTDGDGLEIRGMVSLSASISASLFFGIGGANTTMLTFNGQFLDGQPRINFNFYVSRLSATLVYAYGNVQGGIGSTDMLFDARTLTATLAEAMNVYMAAKTAAGAGDVVTGNILEVFGYYMP